MKKNAQINFKGSITNKTFFSGIISGISNFNKDFFLSKVKNGFVIGVFVGKITKHLDESIFDHWPKKSMLKSGVPDMIPEKSFLVIDPLSIRFLLFAGKSRQLAARKVNHKSPKKEEKIQSKCQKIKVNKERAHKGRHA